MEERELKTKVMRFVGEIGIALAGKVHTVAFDVVRGRGRDPVDVCHPFRRTSPGSCRYV